jgi:malate dehydrogenase (oxaloacetate-decarboxylating)(NADP+)
MDENSLREAALDYHRLPRPGKISVTPTKGLINQLDLSLAYSPGVAYACTAIAEDPQEAATLTSRANLVAVISNGTAVLGLGNIGPLASKPVMEGKGCLFKKFADIDVFDIEVAENDPDSSRCSTTGRWAARCRETRGRTARRMPAPRRSRTSRLRSCRSP